MVAWNTQIFIFGWSEYFLLGISYVNIIDKLLNFSSYVWNSQMHFYPLLWD